ncbi:MAG TPA: hypothetical protein VHZ33_28345 [Trebonia sp.]|jgi:hypothetical protein|nr:hypothetical protein [Trebonia sp.]
MHEIDLKVTVERPMPGAGIQILDTFEPRMRSVGFNPSSDGDTTTYRPKFVGLFFVWLYRRLADEHVTLAFEQQGQVTEVRVTGKVRDRAYAEVSEEFGAS